jgi:hypothetical protein
MVHKLEIRLQSDPPRAVIVERENQLVGRVQIQPVSAPGVNRTPDLQVRRLGDVGALPCPQHRSPATTRLSRSLRDVRGVQMGWAWAQFGDQPH